MGKYTENDSAKDTNVDRSHARGAWHNARNDSVGTRFEGRSQKKEYAKGSYYDDVVPSKPSRSPSSGGCYIASASLQGTMDIDQLDPLKEWRYKVLERSHVGKLLSDFYRSTAPRIAAKVGRMPRLARLLRVWFVKPALFIVNKPRSIWRSVKLSFLFITGMLIATLGTLFKN